METHLKARTCLLLLVFVVLGVYYPAIFSPANSVDDPGTIDYLLNHDSFSLREIFVPTGSYYRPFLILSFLGDKYLWGLQESFMHLENVLFHLVNVLLLFAVARNCRLAQGVTSAVLPVTAALLFALHPINAEAVNWISGRTDLVCCIFVLLSTWLMLRPGAGSRASLLAALCLLAACLTKETAIFFLPAAIILPFFYDQNGWERRGLLATARQHWQHLLVFVTAGAAFFLFRALVSRRGDEGVARVLSHVSVTESAGGLANVRLPLKAAGFYLKKLFVPFPLNFGIIHVSDLYLPVGILLCLVVLWLLTRRTLASYFFLCAAAISGSALMIPLLKMTWTPLAERYMYLPSAFFVLGLSFAVDRWELAHRYQTFVALFIAVILSIACYGTASRTILWQDNYALFQDTLRKSPKFVPAQNEMAGALYALGKRKEGAALIRSMQLPESLLNYQFGTVSQAAAKVQSGDLEGAEALLNRLLDVPGRTDVDVRRRLLALYELMVTNGKATRAQVYPKSVEMLTHLYKTTDDPFYQYRLGIVHMQEKQRRLAHESFLLAAAGAPLNAVYRLPAQKLAAKMSQE